MQLCSEGDEAGHLARTASGSATEASAVKQALFLGRVRLLDRHWSFS